MVTIIDLFHLLYNEPNNTNRSSEQIKYEMSKFRLFYFTALF